MHARTEGPRTATDDGAPHPARPPHDGIGHRPLRDRECCGPFGAPLTETRAARSCGCRFPHKATSEWDRIASHDAQSRNQRGASLDFVASSRAMSIDAATDPLVAGEEALASGDWDGARAAFERVLEDATSARAEEGLGRALWWLQDTEGAIAHMERAYAAYREAGELGAGGRERALALPGVRGRLRERRQSARAGTRGPRVFCGTRETCRSRDGSRSPAPSGPTARWRWRSMRMRPSRRRDASATAISRPRRSSGSATRKSRRATSWPAWPRSMRRSPPRPAAKWRASR